MFGSAQPGPQPRRAGRVRRPARYAALSRACAVRHCAGGACCTYTLPRTSRIETVLGELRSLRRQTIYSTAFDLNAETILPQLRPVPRDYGFRR
jgi:hypothetical protein